MIPKIRERLRAWPKLSGLTSFRASRNGALSSWTNPDSACPDVTPEGSFFRDFIRGHRGCSSSPDQYKKGRRMRRPYVGVPSMIDRLEVQVLYPA